MRQLVTNATLSRADHAVGPAVPFVSTARLLEAAIVGTLVLSASLFGILTRPAGFLAAVWPANALLVATLVRLPHLNTPLSWLSAFIGYGLADLLTGNGLQITILLTLANIVGAGTGVFLFSMLRTDDRQLKRPVSVLFMFAICIAIGITAGVAGSGASRIMLGRDMLSGFAFWFITELVNSLIVLPAILTAPRRTELMALPRQWLAIARSRSAATLPLMALAVSIVGSVIIGGPGAIAFAVPALLWCSLSYGLFPTSLLVLAFCTWELIAISSGIISIPLSADAITSTMSIRLGVALVALAPLTTASSMATRDELLARLDRAVSRDALTGVLSRRAFMEQGTALVRKGPAAVMMLDIDHFKRVNDLYGHETGDRVLARCAETAAGLLRPDDLLARLGGEEFAIVAPGASHAEATAVAESIRAAIAKCETLLDDGRVVRVTTSIGVTCSDAGADGLSIETLLKDADRALYVAKETGRDSVVVSGTTAPAAS